MIITSMMLRMITAGGRGWIQVCHLPGLPIPTQASPSGELGLTEGHPGLPQVQVHTEVRLVRASLTTQPSIFHVAMQYSCTGEPLCYHWPQPNHRSRNAAKQVQSCPFNRKQKPRLRGGCCCLRAFALTVPAAWFSLSPTGSLTSSSLCSKVTFSCDLLGSLPPFRIIPSYTPNSYPPSLFWQPRGDLVCFLSILPIRPWNISSPRVKSVLVYSLL